MTRFAAALLAFSLAGCSFFSHDEEPARPAKEANRKAEKAESRKAKARNAIEPTAQVTNPTSGASLAVYFLAPVGDGPFPVMVMVPGGRNPGTEIMGNTQVPFLKEGFALVYFDPDGRGKSTGNEDFNGFASQDGLFAVMQWAATWPKVDPKRLAVASTSFGSTMASGALTRHETTARFFMDWEGPTSRKYLACRDGATEGDATGWGACDDEKWWGQREAFTFIPKLKIPYWRIQTERFHNLPKAEVPDYTPVLELIQAAEAGGVPIVGINEMAPNPKLGTVADIVVLPETADQFGIMAKQARLLMEQTSGITQAPGLLPPGVGEVTEKKAGKAKAKAKARK